MRLPALCLALLFFSGCAHQSAPATTSELTPERVLAWADLDAHLGRHPQQLQVGQADGRAVLGTRVMLLNAEDIRRFVALHGYAGVRRVVAERRTPSTLEIDVEIAGRDGQVLRITLLSDGGLQGVG